MPTYSANRPSIPTLTEPTRCPPAKSTESRTSSSTAPASRRAAASDSVERRRGRQLHQLTVRLVRRDRVQEVRRRRRLVGGDHGDELVRGHRCQRVVRPLLLADGRHRLGRQVLAAGRAGAVRRVDERLVGQHHQLLAQRVVQGCTQLVGGDAHRGEQVGTPDVADEERVAGEHGCGLGTLALRRAGQVAHHDRDRLGCVARRRQELQLDIAHGDALAVVHQPGGEPGSGGVAEDDLGAGRGGQLQVARQEVGVEVRLDHVGDGQPRGLGVTQVLVDVATGVHHRGQTARLVGDQVRGLREALQVVLVDLHVGTSSVREQMRV